MNILRQNRQSGNTIKCIRRSFETQYNIVCLSHQHATSILNIAKKLNLDIPQPITYQELIDKELLKTNGFIFDNLETFLTRLTDNKPIDLVVLAEEDLQLFEDIEKVKS